MYRRSITLAIAAAAMLTAAACGDNGGTNPGDVSGLYALTAVNGKPLPFTMLDDKTGAGCDFVVRSASISLDKDHTYSARTDWGVVSAGQILCSASRVEVGTYELTGDRVALRGRDGYSRSLTAHAGTLTQRGGGDFDGFTLTYRR